MPEFNTPTAAAMFRAFVLALLTGLSTALTTWATTDVLKTILIAAGTAAITTFVARSGIEGGLDQRRANAGNVHGSDVKPTPATPTTPTTPA